VAERLLILFLKAPRPGQVKTRLAADLGPARAAEVARALAERVLAQTRPRAGEYTRVVAFTPTDARAEIQRWLREAELWPQEGQDLGARMHAALERGLRSHARVVLVGTDVPGLTRALVLDAFAALESDPLVLGPARDGGYYLVGLRAPQPALFTDMPWGTPGVLEETVARASRLGLAAVLLPVLDDVDTVDDLRACGAFVLDPRKPAG
jgi:rSAM/selenodomain-associated transferase 1